MIRVGSQIARIQLASLMPISSYTATRSRALVYKVVSKEALRESMCPSRKDVITMLPDEWQHNDRVHPFPEAAALSDDASSQACNFAITYVALTNTAISMQDGCTTPALIDSLRARGNGVALEHCNLCQISPCSDRG